MNRKVYAVILASGSGERLGWHVPKQFMKIAGKTLLEHTTDVFEKSEYIDEVIIVTHPQHRNLTEEILLKNSYKKVSKILNGGKTRRASSTIGIKSINDDNSIAFIHDAVMPFVSDSIIEKCIQALEKYNAVDVAIPAVDTIIRVNNDSTLIKEIPPRRNIMRGLTPQVFNVGTIKKAHALALIDSNVEVTDDCSLILRYKLGDVYVVRGEKTSLKVTHPEDVYLAEKLFQLKSSCVPENISLDGLKDKVIVVFGASRGIGKAMVDVSKTYGAKIYGFSRGNGVDVVSIAKVAEALEGVYQKEKRIDCVAVTSGVLRMGKIETRDSEDIAEEINVNYIGSVNVVKASTKYLKESKGSILLFAGTSYTRGRALYAIYTSTKAAIVNLVQGLAEEFITDDIRINAMNPERIATLMRSENFGNEPEETLLKPVNVAMSSLKTLLSDLTGQMVDVKTGC